MRPSQVSCMSQWTRLSHCTVDSTAPLTRLHVNERLNAKKIRKSMVNGNSRPSRLEESIPEVPEECFEPDTGQDVIEQDTVGHDRYNSESAIHQADEIRKSIIKSNSCPLPLEESTPEVFEDCSELVAGQDVKEQDTVGHTYNSES